MSKKKDFGEGPLFTITNYIWWLFLGNFYFMLCSFLLILTIVAYKEKLFTDGLGFFLISLLPEGPAFTALLSIMGKLIREKDINVTYDYFKAYKINFIQSLFAWTLQVIVVFIIIEDLRITRTMIYGKFIIPIFIMILIFLIVIGFYVYPILTRFYLSIKDLTKLSIYYSIKKIKNSLYAVFIVTFAVFMIKYMAILSLFLFGSVISYLIMYVQQDVLKEIEEKKKNDATFN